MKKPLLTLAITLLCLRLMAQTQGGPDLYGNIWRDSNDPNGPTYNWIDITNEPEAELISGLADDNYVGPFQLPAPFPFYWYTVDRFWIGSNGYIAFDGIQFSHPFPLIPVSNTVNDYLAPMMTDLNFVNTGPAGAGNPASCYYWTSQSGDSAIITFDSVPFWQSGNPQWGGENTFQVIFNYLDSTITFQYKTQIGASASTASFVTVGIENISGSDGLMCYSNIYPTSNYALRFYPPATSTFQVSDAASNYVNNPSTGAIFLPANAQGTFEMKCQVKNKGNTTLNPFSVTGQVRNSGGALQVSNNFTTGTLAAGQTEDIVYANPFIPVFPGLYRYINVTALPNDAVASNNTQELEIQVVDTTLASIELKYDDGSAVATGISWSGGDGGCANYFIPPFYPCDVTSVSAFIVADPNVVGYYIKLIDDDGPGGSAGTVLDSVYVAGGTFTTGIFTATQLNQAVRINDGGFYVAWEMAGDGVSLGQDQTIPFSNRTFEILSGVMSDYRYREIEDLMIRATITRVGTGIGETAPDGGLGQFYPNPASGNTAISIDASLTGHSTGIRVDLHDSRGRLVSTTPAYVFEGRAILNVAGMESGVYTAKISAGNRVFSRKLTIVK